MYERRRRRYFVLMTACLALFVGAWAVVRLWSVPLAVAMCLIAMVIPPVAAIVGNRRSADERWWDEEPTGNAVHGKDAHGRPGGGSDGFSGPG